MTFKFIFWLDIKYILTSNTSWALSSSNNIKEDFFLLKKASKNSLFSGKVLSIITEMNHLKTIMKQITKRMVCCLD